MKKIIITLSLMLVFLLSSCKLKKVETKRYVDGDYVYCLQRVNGKAYAGIIELTEQGLEKETLVIPTTIGDYEVGYMGVHYWGQEYPDFKSEKLKNLYMNYQVGFMYDNFFKKVTTLENAYFIIFNKLPSSDSSFNCINLLENNPNMNLYIPKFDYDCLYEKNFFDDFSRIYYANVSYYVEDYVFFIDDVDGGLVNVIPPTPILEGKTFVGWYKDEEYKEKFDFENDIIPKKEYDEKGNYLYNEYKIYARFE